MKKLLLLGALFATFGLVVLILNNPLLVKAQQSTCPDSGDWIKVEGLNSTSYTYTVPQGKEVVEWCWKASTALVLGTSGTPSTTTVTVTSTEFNQPGGPNAEPCTAPGQPHTGCAIQNLSHASFRLQDSQCKETKSCPDECRVESTQIQGDCGTITCEANAPEVQSCPTECGYQGGTVPDGECGVIECPATQSCVSRSDFNLTSMCRPSDSTGQMRVRNNSSSPQAFTLYKVGGGYLNTDTAPVGDALYTVPWTSSSDTYKLEIGGYTFTKAIGNNPLCEEPEPSPSPSPSPSPEVSPSPSPSVSPSPSPTPSPGVGGRGHNTVLGVDNYVCPNTEFVAVMDVFDNDTPIEDEEVTFTFNGQEKKVKTNKDGRATATFGIADGTLQAEVPGYPSQSRSLSALDCPSEGGEVLGTSTDSGVGGGQILGASTLADTGTAPVSMAWFGVIGGISSAAAAWKYGKEE